MLFKLFVYLKINSIKKKEFVQEVKDYERKDREVEEKESKDKDIKVAKKIYNVLDRFKNKNKI